MSDGQDKLDLGSGQQEGRVEEYKFEPIKGYPMLNWRGKRPFTSTQFYPAQLKEVHGPEVDGWRNKIFWGDNLQVMGHLLKDFRGKIDLVYIDPPFDSKADYKKTIKVRTKETSNNHSNFEEKQYSDIWVNDEFLQYIYERLILIRELMHPEGSIFLHCDWHKSHHFRCILDEVFGNGGSDGKASGFKNEIIWHYKTFQGQNHSNFAKKHDNILFYSKSKAFHFHEIFDTALEDTIDAKRWSKFIDSEGIIYGRNMPTQDSRFMRYLNKWVDTNGRDPQPDEVVFQAKGQPVDTVWDLKGLDPKSGEKQGYPTQKPEELVSRIIECASREGDLVMDCFMGSGTTQAVCQKMGRRFIGADINLGAIQTTCKRLLGLDHHPSKETAGFEVYNVNNYDLFRNPIEAKELLIDALEVQPLEGNRIFDGEKDGRLVKIMPVNRIATKADLGELIAGFDQRQFQRRQDEQPNQPVEKILLVCMGHQPDLKAELELQAKPFKIDVEVVDILRDKSQLEFKRDSEAKLAIREGELVIENFYPMNLLQKLSLQQEQVGEWRELVDSAMVDWNYDGAVLQPAVVDVPGKHELVAGRYQVPSDAGTIRVKITDLLSESWEGEIDG